MSKGARAGGRARLWRLAMLAGGLAGAPLPASATASLDCTVDDKAVAFEAQAVVSHGLAESLGNFRAAITLKAKGLPEDLAKLELDGAALAHHWLYGSELKLRLYHERTEGPHATVDMVVQTRSRPGSEEAFAGRYVLTVFQVVEGSPEGKTLTFKGKVACSVG